MRRTFWVLFLAVSTGVLAFSVDAMGAPYTLGTVSGAADVAPFDDSDPHHAAASNWIDNSASTRFWSGSGSADAAFGVSAASLDLAYSALSSLGLSHAWAVTSATYSLRALPQAGGQWSDIIETLVASGSEPNGDVSIASVLTGNLQFVYGVPYELVGVLSVTGHLDGVDATSTSTWSDVITFSGGTWDTAAIARFTVSLSGSFLSEQQIVPSVPYPIVGGPGPWNWDHGAASFESRLKAIAVPEDARMEAASGTQYVVQVPDTNSSLLLFGIGLAGLGACRKWW